MFFWSTFSRAAATAALLVTFAWGSETQFWVNTTRNDYEQASLKRLSLRSDGRISLAPALKELFDPSVSYLWAVARDSKGTVYAGGGNQGLNVAKVFAVDASGKGRTLGEVPGLQVQALAVDANDRLYAATAPDGKVYRFSPEGKAEVFYDPQAKYIWALAFEKGGDLFVATGDRGEIHRVTPAGQGSVFFKADDEHIRSLAMTPGGDLIVGTEPGGLILRVNEKGGFVLHQAAKREVTAVAVTKDGSIYAAAVGAKGTTPAPAAAPAPAPAPTGNAANTTARTPATSRVAPSSVTGGSELYMITTDGFTSKVWSDATEVIYSIVLDKEDRPLLGTGNRGNIYRVDAVHMSTQLLNLAPTQVTALASAPNGAIYAVTGNIGKVYVVGPELEKEGVLESEVLDAGWFSEWGRIEGKVDAGGGSIKWETRSGNVDRAQSNWSPWSVVTDRVTSPSARFLQYRMTLTGNAELVNSEIAYLPRNVAPIIEAIEILTPNYRFPAPSSPNSSNESLSVPAMSAKQSVSTSTPSSDPGSATLDFDKGWQSARWKAADPNGDSLHYKVEIRGKGEKQWKPLNARYSSRNFSFNTEMIPDGEYQIRVTACDEPSNVPGKTLTHSLESAWFTIDNAAPQIKSLTAKALEKQFTIAWTAADERSILKKAEYSLNGGNWIAAEPANHLHDAKELHYSLSVAHGSESETIVAVRVSDYADNVVVAKTLVK